MLIDVLAAAAIAVGGTITLVLWVDHRVALDGAAAVTLAALIAATTAAAAAALTATALQFPLGAVAAVTIALAGWTLLVTLTTHPPPGHVGPDGEPPRP